jgi:hypothetical protein
MAVVFTAEFLADWTDAVVSSAHRFAFCTRGRRSRCGDLRRTCIHRPCEHSSLFPARNLASLLRLLAVAVLAYLHFELQNCGSNFPIVPGNSQVVVQTAFDIKPNQSDGSILGQVIPNDLILCGNTSRTFWKVTPMKNSAQALTPAAGLLYQICSVGCYPAGGTAPAPGWEDSQRSLRRA